MPKQCPHDPPPLTTSPLLLCSISQGARLATLTTMLSGLSSHCSRCSWCALAATLLEGSASPGVGEVAQAQGSKAASPPQAHSLLKPLHNRKAQQTALGQQQARCYPSVRCTLRVLASGRMTAGTCTPCTPCNRAAAVLGNNCRRRAMAAHQEGHQGAPPSRHATPTEAPPHQLLAAPHTLGAAQAALHTPGEAQGALHTHSTGPKGRPHTLLEPVAPTTVPDRYPPRSCQGCCPTSRQQSSSEGFLCGRHRPCTKRCRDATGVRH